MRKYDLFILLNVRKHTMVEHVIRTSVKSNFLQNKPNWKFYA